MSGGAFDASFGAVFVLYIVNVKDAIDDVSGCSSLA
jgi:hypothetical protein